MWPVPRVSLHSGGVSVDECFKGNEMLFAVDMKYLGSTATADFGDLQHGWHEPESFHKGRADETVIETTHIFFVRP